VFFTRKSFSQVDTLDGLLVDLVAARVRQYFLRAVYDVRKKIYEANRKINAIIHYGRNALFGSGGDGNAEGNEANQCKTK